MDLLDRISSRVGRTRTSVRSSLVRRRSSRKSNKKAQAQSGDDDLERILNKANTALHYIEGEGARTLQETAISIAESETLSDILNTQRKFDRFYFLSMKYLDYGAEANGKLDEYIRESGEDAEVTDKIEELDMQLYLFKKRVDERRQAIQESIHIFTELDKAYDWALRGVEILSGLDMKVDGTLTEEKCQEHHDRIEEFLTNNPPIPNSHFEELCANARELKQTEFLQQCENVRVRCRETHRTILTRISTIDGIQASPEQIEDGEGSGDVGLSVVDVVLSGSDVEKQEEILVQVETPKSERRVERKTFAKAKEARMKRDITRKIREEDTNKQRDSVHSEFSVDSGISMSSKETRQSNPDRDEVLISHDAGESSTDPPNETQGEGETTPAEEDEQDLTLTESFINRMVDSKNDDKDGETDSDLSWILATVNSLDGDKSDQDSACETTPPRGPLESNRHIMDVPPTSPQEMKEHERKMFFLVNEMIRTEEAYVSYFKYTIDNYLPEMDREDIPHGLRGQRSVVFGNLEKIYLFHLRQFLPSLRQYDAKPSRVGECLLKFKKEFGLYSLYSKNKPKSDALLSDYRSFFNLKRVSLDDKLDLASYLLKPIQRLGKYALLLQDIILACEEEDLNRSSLMESIDMIHFQMRHGNDLLALDHLKGVDFNVREQGELLRQKAFTVYRRHRKAVRHVFLFEEMMVFTKPMKGVKAAEEYRYKFSLKMNDIGLTENVGHSGLRFQVWFRKIRTGVAYTLKAPSVQVKQQWTTSISRILWNQAMRSKANQTAEFRSMGLESKPSLDLKPSADMIENRSVDLQLRRKKRPQSIATTSLTDPNPVGKLRKSSWLGSPPPTIAETAEEEDYDTDRLDGRCRFKSELNVTSLPDLSVAHLDHGESVDTLVALDIHQT